MRGISILLSLVLAWSPASYSSGASPRHGSLGHCADQALMLRGVSFARGRAIRFEVNMHRLLRNRRDLTARSAYFWAAATAALCWVLGIALWRVWPRDHAFGWVAAFGVSGYGFVALFKYQRLGS